MKECFKCNISKPLNEFYRHPGMGDGHLGKCKECTKADAKARRDKKIQDPDWVEKEAERSRLKYYRKGYKACHNKARIIEKYKNKYPEKAQAQCAMNGQGKSGLHAHHWSYNEHHRTDVIWIRPAFHLFIHRFLKYDQQEMMYRVKSNGRLLANKEDHALFLGTLKKRFEAYRAKVEKVKAGS